jgi:predicted glycosyltransferase
LDTDVETLLALHDAPGGDLFPASEEEAVALCRRVRCPMLIVHGTLDRCQPVTRAERLAEITGGRLVILEGAGHAPMGRHPVVVNRLIKEFVDSIQPLPQPPRTWTFAPRRVPRVLFLSSPIGLGHAQRDAAVAAELRKLRPHARIDWLTQHPVTRVLEDRGEHIHPAAAHLANESRHIESEAAEHDIHVFQAIRDMDEIFVSNFMVFDDAVAEEPYDLVIGDEAWEVDHFWHENPELKRSPFVWMTDFVGWVPFGDGGDREAILTADYNAEMIEHVERLPRLRDRSIFVGNPEDIVDRDFGPGLPSIREWTEAHYEFSGYVTGFDPVEVADRLAVRAELGYGPDEKVCVVTVGGSGVGEHLLRKVIAAYPEAKRLVPELRMVVVAGPRIDPERLPSHEGLEVRGYVDRLYCHLGVCDLAVVQGGLTTTMELTAAKRPFLYFPLAHHFEQRFHVAHRLDRYGAGRRMDYASTDPEELAVAMAEELGRTVRYRDVETDGAARAASLIAELL